MTELIRMAEQLAEQMMGYTHKDGDLTDDECMIIMYYAKELERELAAFCPNDCGDDGSHLVH